MMHAPRTLDALASKPLLAMRRPFGPTRAASLAMLVLLGGCASGGESGPTIEERLRAQATLWEGTPYQEGGNTLSGVDCSGLMQQVVGEVFERELPRTAKQQEKLGVAVNWDALLPGDLVFFRTKGIGPFFKKRHVGVYLGAGEFLHASSSKGVVVSSLEGGYWRKSFKRAKRIAPELFASGLDQ